MRASLLSPKHHLSLSHSSPVSHFLSLLFLVVILTLPLSFFVTHTQLICSFSHLTSFKCSPKYLLWRHKWHIQSQSILYMVTVQQLIMNGCIPIVIALVKTTLLVLIIAILVVITERLILWVLTKFQTIDLRMQSLLEDVPPLISYLKFNFVTLKMFCTTLPSAGTMYCKCW